ncbi:hypothetical protein [Methylobrevis albus]|uniref:Uncharacterized protein n=1 Tax=Methylobrevis albus TaxID=2793297 RepID=A0A931MXT4_9HYPH|nr:hypothetical protein [Methylobrevis albus]MBH0236334.1 hypothetical protein [Methylobrevis albus]
MDNLLWFFAVAIGPLLLGAAIVYGMTRNRNLTAPEKRAQTAATEELYDKDERSPTKGPVAGEHPVTNR